VARWRIKERAAFAAVIVVVAATLGSMAQHNNDVAKKWRTLDNEQAVVTAQVTNQLQTANSNIVTLNGQVKTLDGQLGSDQSQLSTVANQKEKAIDQTTVLATLVEAAGQVADDLDSCITSSQQLESEISGAGSSPSSAEISGFLSQATQVDQTCGQAQAANQDLQSIIQGSA